MSNEFNTGSDFAKKLDEEDELKDFREKFYIPERPDGSKKIYFTGNSLGLQPKTTENYIKQELKDWAKLGVEGHIEAENPWLPYHEFVTDKLAEVVRAKTTEVVAMNSLTVNLHLLMVSFYRPEGKKRKIVIEDNAFPSDIYAVKSQIKFHKGNPEEDLIILKAREGEHTIRTEDVIELLENKSDEIALLMLSGVNYYTGQFFDMKSITEAAHKNNIIAGWDLAHAAGNIKLELHDWNIDFAAWCSYKYLNSGPGGIAGAFVHERHVTSDLPRFEGWWGENKERRFLMEENFDPIPSVEAWQLSNPPIFQLAALNASLDIFREAGMERLEAKSHKMTAYMEYLINEIKTDRIEVITPSNKMERGCQLSLKVKGADKSLYQMISEKHVVADWREPDVIRIAPVPLYNSYQDCYEFAEILKERI